MAVIELPDEASPSEAVPAVRDFGTVLTPFLGGPEQRLNRLGTRMSVTITLPPKRTRDEAMVIQSRLLRAREDRLLMPWPQPGFDTGNPGSPTVSAAVQSGSVLPVTGLTPGYTVKEGQWVSIVHSGRRYLHMVTAETAVPSSGAVSLPIWPMLRTTLAAGDVVEVARPMIEGLVNSGSELSWQISVDLLVAFTFTISESA